ncbi:dihydropteroate synthase [Holophaga foetida]|uniref:dihydropteroate synthase n=1 Tax=Holophaga foetida TaxID=35839 RepID=UPI0002471772|nr:dihydropteroate synthase [Holophaga foetida]
MVWNAGPAPRYLGILNLTPDSFSDGGRYFALEDALVQARRLVEAGASILDLGAESTRPGAAYVSPEAEWQRIAPVLARLRTELPGIPLSLDTRHASTARLALANGVSIMNDVAGLRDPAMLALAVESGCDVIAMRNRMEGKTFVMPSYDDPSPCTAETAIGELREVRDRLLAAGIPRERILLDLGFGFGTSYLEDLAMWECLPTLPDRLDWPAEAFCIAISRKRFLSRMAGTPELPPNQRDGLTAQAHRSAMSLGYRVFRTHALPSA